MKEVKHWTVNKFIRRLGKMKGTKHVLRLIRFWMNKVEEENHSL